MAVQQQQQEDLFNYYFIILLLRTCVLCSRRSARENHIAVISLVGLFALSAIEFESKWMNI